MKIFLLFQSIISCVLKPIDLNTFGADLRVVLGLIQDHTGLICCSSVFAEICRLVDFLYKFLHLIYEENFFKIKFLKKVYYINIFFQNDEQSD